GKREKKHALERDLEMKKRMRGGGFRGCAGGGVPSPRRTATGVVSTRWSDTGTIRFYHGFWCYFPPRFVPENATPRRRPCFVFGVDSLWRTRRARRSLPVERVCRLPGGRVRDFGGRLIAPPAR
ncbi:unnamed protein product, partial [Ectocarpus fasciculatus]